MINTPRIANLYEKLFVIGAGTDGRVRYSRKDPNWPGNDLTGQASSDQWLDRGKAVDPRIPDSISDLETLTFNSDLYLAGQKTVQSQFPRGVYVINFGRAAMKQLLTEKWGLALGWGNPGGQRLTDINGNGLEFAKGQEIPMLGDFNGDGQADLIKFTQRNVDNVGPAPVYVALANGGSFDKSRVWHKFFSLKGEVPMVGEFNGDGRDDIISFTQQEQKDASGKVIGPAVVWVALSNGKDGFNTSSIWHKFFSLNDEVPMVGDFNGDGRDDIISFTQREQKDASGKVIGPAVVWVALSNAIDGFNTSSIWRKFFSLKGEVPMVGDFNGDGRDDVISFVQTAQKNADGSLLGNAPVWVALSDGAKFGRSSVCHSFFSLRLNALVQCCLPCILSTSALRI